MKKKPNFIHFFSILLIINLLLLGCGSKTSSTEQISVNPKEGFVAMHTFENNAWTFPKVAETINKELQISGNFPDPQAFYQLTLSIDFYDNIPETRLPLVVTTASPDGNSTQSTQLLIEFADEESVTTIETENGRTLKRATKVIYPAKQFRDEGDYLFTIYSKYAKMSLPGVKSLAIVAVKTK